MNENTFMRVDKVAKELGVSKSYDCGSFVVNGTAVVGKEPKKAL